MRLGVVLLPERRWPDDRWARAEALGFDHAWTYDHLTWRDLRDGPWFAAVPTLAAAALTTSTIRLGTLVASPNFRHPVPFAKELMTLDDLSGGRLTLGIGSGGTGWDATALGQEPWTVRERIGRFEEFVELADRVLSQAATSYEGRWYSAEEARSLGEGMGELQRLSPALWGLAELATIEGDAASAIERCERGYAASSVVGDAAYLFPFAVTGSSDDAPVTTDSDPAGADTGAQEGDG